jgi:hypothetical protein
MTGIYPLAFRGTGPRWGGDRFEFFAKVETAGIEPASATAREMASTSVAGDLISLRACLAGGVARNQLPGWSSDRRERVLTELAC